MPRRDWKLRVSDILEALDKIAGYVKDMDEGAFIKDPKTRDAIIHNLTVIGEAVNHIPEEIQKKNPDTPWPQMRGIRNILVHEYYKINPATLWKTVTVDLPPLGPALRRIL